MARPSQSTLHSGEAGVRPSSALSEPIEMARGSGNFFPQFAAGTDNAIERTLTDVEAYKFEV
jgi:hypothetical protein